jgi:uncharacterized membrane protein YqgA involved in biofilm formation
VIGTIVNAAAIIASGSVGLATRWELSGLLQQRVKVLLGAFMVFVGLSMVWRAVNGSWPHWLALLAAVFGALVLGRLVGGKLGIQRSLNGLGRFAKSRISATQTAGRRNFSDGFVTCTTLFCVEPLVVLGAIPEGLNGDVRPLLLKALLDGLTTMALARTLGWGALAASLPVLAVQGTLWLAARGAAAWLERQGVVNAICATDGMLVFTVALVVLKLRPVALADYFPSLLFAPLLFWLLR